jgi:uncharacterized tellurite resistance protein B-like protein
MLEHMERTMRLRLLRVVTALAWVDGEIHEKEQAFFERLLDKLKLPEDERTIARGYLEKPPHPAEADPTKIPPEYREALVKLAWQMVGADEDVDDDEMAAVRELEALLLGR